MVMVGAGGWMTDIEVGGSLSISPNNNINFNQPNQSIKASLYLASIKIQTMATWSAIELHNTSAKFFHTLQKHRQTYSYVVLMFLLLSSIIRENRISDCIMNNWAYMQY